MIYLSYSLITSQLNFFSRKDITLLKYKAVEALLKLKYEAKRSNIE
jgi:hypothetical protein